MRYFKFEEAAAYCNVSRATIYRWTHAYNLHFIQIGRVTRIAEDELDRFMHSEEFRM